MNQLQNLSLNSACFNQLDNMEYVCSNQITARFAYVKSDHDHANRQLQSLKFILRLSFISTSHHACRLKSDRGYFQNPSQQLASIKFTTKPLEFCTIFNDVIAVILLHLSIKQPLMELRNTIRKVFNSKHAHAI